MLKNLNNKFKSLYSEKKTQYDLLLSKYKKQNFSDRLIVSDNKTKTAWAIVNEINGKPKSGDINIKGDGKTIANRFNDHLMNSVSESLSKLVNIPFSSVIIRNPLCVSLKLVNASEIIEISKKLKNKLSSGYDELSTSLLKNIINVVVEPLVHIINNSLKFGIFPDQLKLAIVVPVYKKGDNTNIENYRPISLLPSFSKIFEHVMCKRIMEFMTEDELLKDCQHGFIRGRSTHTAIFQFTKQILESLEDGTVPLGLFLDLSKAYDTLNHEILLRKLELYGIRGTALKWIASYLSKRSQKVTVGKKMIVLGLINPN